MLKLLGNKNVKKVFSTLGPEQEYFLIDMDYFFKRQDLVLAGRTVVGAPPAKGQELEDQYFGSIKERMSSYMHDVEEELFKLDEPESFRQRDGSGEENTTKPIRYVPADSDEAI